MAEVYKEALFKIQQLLTNLQNKFDCHLNELFNCIMIQNLDDRCNIFA